MSRLTPQGLGAQEVIELLKAVIIVFIEKQHDELKQAITELARTVLRLEREMAELRTSINRLIHANRVLAERLS